MQLKCLLGVLSLLLLSQSAPAQGNNRSRPGGSAAASIEIITRTINDCENRTDRFVKTMRRALRSSALSGTPREAELNRVTKDLERSMDRVGRAWNRDKDISKARSHVQSAVNSAKNVNLTMRSRPLNQDVQRDWAEVRGQLNLLARAFKLSTISW